MWGMMKSSGTPEPDMAGLDDSGLSEHGENLPKTTVDY